MIQQKDFKEQDVKIIGESESIEMGVDADSMQHLMMILSSNLYQNPIGSLVREYTSNAVDANIDAKNTEPVMVRLKQKDGNWYFEVEDFGIGLDDVDFRNTISKYGKSTKRDSTETLGFYGLGAKSAFAYTNTFYYTCIKDGMERKYLLFKNDTGFAINPITEEKTTKKNGTIVNIPVRYGDYNQFLKEIRNQLAYFENVYFDVEPINQWNSVDLNSEFSIFTEKDFHFSTIGNLHEMHLTLGRVNYPIDWNSIGISSIKIPVALKFDLDSGIFPIPNRENIIWNDSTKKLVLKKIKIIADWMVNKYNESVIEFDNIVDAWDLINSRSKTITIGKRVIDVTLVQFLSSIPFKEPIIKGIKLESPSFYKRKFDFMISDYRCVGRIRYETLSTKNLYFNHFDLLRDIGKIVILEDDIKITGFFRDYLKTLPYKTFIKYKLPQDCMIWDKEAYTSILNITGKTKSEEKALIAEWEFVKSSIIKKTIVDGTKLMDSKEYLDFRETNKAIRKLTNKAGLNKQKGQVTIGYSRAKAHGGYMFDKKVFKMEELYKNRFITCYVPDDVDLYYLTHAYKRQKIKFCQIGVQDLKKINQLKLHNVMSLKELERSKVFSKVVTGLRAKKVLKIYDTLFKSHIPILKACANKITSNVDELKLYVAKNTEDVDSDLVTVMLASAETNNLWDLSILDSIKYVENSIKDFEFITIIKEPKDNCSQEDFDKYEQFITSMLLFKKLKFENKLPHLEICVKNELPLDELQLTNKITENETI